MSFNGSGTFVINSTGNPVVTGTVISSTWANALTADLGTGLSTAICKDGQTTTSAAIPFSLGLTSPTGQGFAAGGSQAILGYFAKRATADQSITTNTTLASATNMGFALGASEEWIGTAEWMVGDNLTLTGIKIALAVPAGATIRLGIGFIQSSINATNNGYKTTTSAGTAIDFATTDTTSANSLMHIVFWVLNGATPGTAQIQVAQSTSNAAAITIFKGSSLRADRLA